MTGVAPVDSLAEFTVTEAAAASRLTLARLRACERACCYENCGFAALLLSLVRSGPQGSNLYTLSECLKFCTGGPALVIAYCWSWHCTVIAVEGGVLCVLFLFILEFSDDDDDDYKDDDNYTNKSKSLFPSTLYVQSLIGQHPVATSQSPLHFTHFYSNIPLLYCTICTLLL
jgi:hypothetical protein